MSRRRKKQTTLILSLCVLLGLVLLSLTAEFWANDRPILLSYQGQVYVPLYRYYHPSVFVPEAQEAQVDYRKLDLDGVFDWAVWPLVRWSPIESDRSLDTYPAPPSAEHIMGTDDRGRDVFARVLYGFRYAILFAVLTWILSFSVGTLLGALMGFLGGWVDLLGQRVVEVFEAIPYLLLLLTLVAVFGASMWLLILITSTFSWMMISIYMRAEFLRMRKRDFVEAARASGAGSGTLIFRHILPNSLSPLVTFSPFAIASLIASLAALDYLGFGLPAPTPSWGELFSQAQEHFLQAWWLAVYPSGALFLTLLVFTLIGDGVRELFTVK